MGKNDRKIERGVVKLKCDHCEKTFGCRRYLIKHLQRRHNRNSDSDEKKMLQCSMCGKNFPRLSHLHRHQLTHLNMREWGCPFCIERFVQKPHLIRHIGRKHGEQSGSCLDEKINSNRWRTEDSIPVSVGSNAAIHPVNNLPSAETCASLVPRLLCTRCGHTFLNRSDLKRHSDIKHQPIHCHHCNKTFFGYNQMKAHEMKLRSEIYMCRCGASFARKREFNFHQDSCRGRGSFLCLVCDNAFTQRTQLDRHWKKIHFINKICEHCDWHTDVPLRMTEHMRDEHGKQICGYCGIENPSNDHISSVHWKRLNKSIRIEQKKQIFEVPNGQQFPCTFSVEKLKEECTDAKSDSITDFRQSEIDCSNGDFSEINSETFCVSKPDTHLISHMNTDDCHLNVIISIPDEANSVNLGARLPKDLLSIFPELWDTHVVMIDSFSGSNRFLSVHIPVQRPPPMVDANKWLTVPIYV